MTNPRIKGQEVTILVIADGELVTKLDSIKSAEWEFDLELLEEGYLGETAQRYDEVFNGLAIKLSGHLTSAQHLHLCNSIVQRARRAAGAVIRIDIGTTFYFADGSIVTLVANDVHFASIPFNIGERKEYISTDLDAKASEFQIVD